MRKILLVLFIAFMSVTEGQSKNSKGRPVVNDLWYSTQYET